jgi:transposase
MRIHERVPGDVDELTRRAAAERNALRRDRYRAVLMAFAGDEAAEIAAALGRARRSVQAWAYAYRDGGLDAVQPKPRRGCRPTTLPREREAELVARLDGGPTPADGVCALRGKDVVRILEAEFGVTYTLGGAYDLLRRLGYLLPAVGEKLRATIARMEGKRIRVAVSEVKRRRSVNQNAYMWGVVIQMITDVFRDAGNMVDKDDVFDFLKAEVWKLKQVYVTPDGEVLRGPGSTRHWSTHEMESKLEEARAWAAAVMGLSIPLPNEGELHG